MSLPNNVLVEGDEASVLLRYAILQSDLLLSLDDEQDRYACNVYKRQSKKRVMISTAAESVTIIEYVRPESLDEQLIRVAGFDKPAEEEWRSPQRLLRNFFMRSENFASRKWRPGNSLRKHDVFVWRALVTHNWVDDQAHPDCTVMEGSEPRQCGGCIPGRLTKELLADSSFALDALGVPKSHLSMLANVVNSCTVGEINFTEKDLIELCNPTDLDLLE